MIDMLSDDGNFTTDENGDVVSAGKGANSPTWYGRPANPHKIRAGKKPVQDLVLQHPEVPGTQADTTSSSGAVHEPLTIVRQNANEAAYMKSQTEALYPDVREVTGADMSGALIGIHGLKDVLEQTRRRASNN